MGFVISGIIEVFSELVKKLLVFAISITNNFELNFANSVGQQTKTEKEEVKFVFDDIFPRASSFTGVFMVTAFVILILIFLFKLLTTLLAPISGSSEEPITLTIRTLVAGFLTINAYTIFEIFQDIANNLLSLFKGKQEEIMKTTDLSPNSIFKFLNKPILKDTSLSLDSKKDSSAASKVASKVSGDLFLMFFTFIVFFLILVNFIKLFLEIFERYVVLALLFYTSPLAFATLGSKSSMNIFSSWVRMVSSQFLLMMMNVFFVSVFAQSFVYTLTAENKDVVFSSAQECITTAILWVSWLVVGQKVDQYMQSLGLSTAQAGGSLGAAMLGAAGTAVTAGRFAVSTGKETLSGASRIHQGFSTSRQGGSFLDGFNQKPMDYYAKKGKEKAETRKKAKKEHKDLISEINGNKYNYETAKRALNSQTPVGGYEGQKVAETLGAVDFAKSQGFNVNEKTDWVTGEGKVTATNFKDDGTPETLTIESLYGKSHAERQNYVQPAAPSKAVNNAAKRAKTTPTPLGISKTELNNFKSGGPGNAAPQPTNTVADKGHEQAEKFKNGGGE